MPVRGLILVTAYPVLLGFIFAYATTRTWSSWRDGHRGVAATLGAAHTGLLGLVLVGYTTDTPVTVAVAVSAIVICST